MNLFGLSRYYYRSHPHCHLWLSLLLATLLAGGCAAPPVQVAMQQIAMRQPASAPIPAATHAQPLSLASHLGGPALSVAVQGHYAYVGHSFEFAVIDIADPQRPARIGYLVLSANDVAVAGDYAYVATRTGLAVVAVTNPAAPSLVGRMALPAPAQAVAIGQGYAYVVAKGGLWSVDVHRPIAPQITGFVALPGRLESIALAEGQAYVTGNRGLTVLSLADPRRPQVTAFTAIPGYAESVTLTDGQVWIAAGDQGVQHIGETGSMDPAQAPTHSIPLPGYAEALALAGPYGYVADGDGLQVVEWLDVRTPQLRGFLDLPGYTLDVALAGGYAYVVDRDQGLVVVDVTQPDTPRQVGALPTPGFVGSVSVDGNLAYVTTLPQGDVHVLDLTDPAQVRQLGWIETLDTAEAAVSEATPNGEMAEAHLLYVAGGYAGLEILDVAQPSRPRSLAWLATPGYATRVVVARGIAALATASGVQLVDVHDPLHPQESGCICALGGVDDLAWVDQGLLVLGSDSSLRLWTLDDPVAPQARSALALIAQSARLAAAEGLVLIAGETGVQVVTIGRDGQMRQVGFYPTAHPVRAIAIATTVGYVATADGGGEVIDLSSPAQPRQVGTFTTADEVQQVEVQGHTILLADRAGGLFVLRSDILPGPDPAR